MAKCEKRNAKRDLEIVSLRENKGWTFKQIGDRYEIGRVRARQLYIRMVIERDNRQLGIGA